MRRKILNAIWEYEMIIYQLEKGKYDFANERMSKLNNELAEINNQSICSCAISIEQKFEQIRMLKDLFQRITDAMSHDDAIIGLPENNLESRTLLYEISKLEDNILDERFWIESGLTKEDKEYIKEKLAHKEINVLTNVFSSNNKFHKELAECIGEYHAKELINKWSNNERDVIKFIKLFKKDFIDKIDSYNGNKELVIGLKRTGFYTILNKLHLYSATRRNFYKLLE